MNVKLDALHANILSSVLSRCMKLSATHLAHSNFVLNGKLCIEISMHNPSSKTKIWWWNLDVDAYYSLDILVGVVGVV